MPAREPLIRFSSGAGSVVGSPFRLSGRNRRYFRTGLTSLLIFVLRLLCLRGVVNRFASPIGRERENDVSKLEIAVDRGCGNDHGADCRDRGKRTLGMGWLGMLSPGRLVVRPGLLTVLHGDVRSVLFRGDLVRGLASGPDPPLPVRPVPLVL